MNPPTNEVLRAALLSVHDDLEADLEPNEENLDTVRNNLRALRNDVDPQVQQHLGRLRISVPRNMARETVRQEMRTKLAQFDTAMVRNYVQREMPDMPEAVRPALQTGEAAIQRYILAWQENPLSTAGITAGVLAAGYVAWKGIKYLVSNTGAAVGVLGGALLPASWQNWLKDSIGGLFSTMFGLIPEGVRKPITDWWEVNRPEWLPSWLGGPSTPAEKKAAEQKAQEDVKAAEKKKEEVKKAAEKKAEEAKEKQAQLKKLADDLADADGTIHVDNERLITGRHDLVPLAQLRPMRLGAEDASIVRRGPGYVFRIRGNDYRFWAEIPVIGMVDIGTQLTRAQIVRATNGEVFLKTEGTLTRYYKLTDIPAFLNSVAGINAPASTREADRPRLSIDGYYVPFIVGGPRPGDVTLPGNITLRRERYEVRVTRA